MAEATYDTPVVRTKVGARVSNITINRSGPSIQVSFESLDGDDNPMDNEPGENVSLGGAEVVAFLAVLTNPTSYPGEPANAAARANWRVVKACVDAGYLGGLTQV